MMTASLQASGDLRDKTAEAIFHAIYGSPWVQGLLGVTRDNGRPRPKPGMSPDQEAVLAAKIEELRATMAEGGPLEAGVRRSALHRWEDNTASTPAHLKSCVEPCKHTLISAWLTSRRSSAISGPRWSSTRKRLCEHYLDFYQPTTMSDEL